MGADIHITVGRVCPRIQGPTQQGIALAAGTALAVLGNHRFQFGDFEFTSDIPDEVDLGRNYALFSFLAGVRGSLRPIIAQEKLQEATREFISWVNDEHAKMIRGEAKGGWYSDNDDFLGDLGTYDVGEHSRVFYPIQTLAAFNYDDVALQEDPESDSNNPIYFRDEEGTTYREYCGEQYFKFLNWCVLSNWHFVIFGFDN